MREVCTNTVSVRVPGARASVEGVANVRGTLVTVVRAEALFGQTESHDGPSPWLVVLSSHEGRIGLGVDEVEDLDVVDTAPELLDLERELTKIFGR